MFTVADNLLEAFPARIMLLENHGVVTVGETIADAMFRLWYVTKAAEIQVAIVQVRRSRVLCTDQPV